MKIEEIKIGTPVIYSPPSKNSEDILWHKLMMGIIDEGEYNSKITKPKFAIISSVAETLKNGKKICNITCQKRKVEIEHLSIATKGAIAYYNAFDQNLTMYQVEYAVELFNRKRQKETTPGIAPNPDVAVLSINSGQQLF